MIIRETQSSGEKLDEENGPHRRAFDRPFCGLRASPNGPAGIGWYENPAVVSAARPHDFGLVQRRKSAGADAFADYAEFAARMAQGPAADQSVGLQHRSRVGGLVA